jgi:hypothetical protein
MVSITSLWLAILVATVLVFIASSLMHTVLKYHDSDFARFPDEDAALAALRGLNIPPGNYCAPRPAGHGGMKDPAFMAKVQQGPMLMLNLGPMMLQWFIYVLVVSALVAYLAAHTLDVGAPYLKVFRVAGCAAFLAYAAGQPIEGIWYSRNWSSVGKNIFDGLVYGMLTGGAFGWLWPRLVA